MGGDIAGGGDCGGGPAGAGGGDDGGSGAVLSGSIRPDIQDMIVSGPLRMYTAPT